MFGISNGSSIAKLNTGQSRQRRRWSSVILVIAFVMMLLPLDAMAITATETNYTTGDSVIALDAEIQGTSTNNHTEAYKV